MFLQSLPDNELFLRATTTALRPHDDRTAPQTVKRPVKRPRLPRLHIPPKHHGDDPAVEAEQPNGHPAGG